MGQLLNTICQECLNEKNHVLGIGQSSLEISMNLLKGDLSWIEKQVSKSTFEKIKLLEKNNQKDKPPGLRGLSCDFYAKLFECKSCNTVEVHNDIVIRLDNDETFQVKWNCGECNGLLCIAEKPINEYACSECGSTLLKVIGEGVWD